MHPACHIPLIGVPASIPAGENIDFYISLERISQKALDLQGDAWVTIETFHDEDKPKRQRHAPRKPRSNLHQTDSRRQSQALPSIKQSQSHSADSAMRDLETHDLRHGLHLP